ncbi:MAG: phosphopantothenate/pantothenate synthetase [Candidatus Thalassarchaeaceae archaeon]|nr:phosphopantothenate/pantothenate synthetase [Candidatus Thalassarchaeaceae archaeon]
MSNISKNHPRYRSLIAREKIVDASNNGLLAHSAMIAHGRGEAFDYLLGEETSKSAKLAIKEVAYRLNKSKNPIISVNGNTVVLAGEDLIRIAAVLECPIEINLYYRTEERISKLLRLLNEQKNKVTKEACPEGWIGDWDKSVNSVRLLGQENDGLIIGLEGPRAICSFEGIQRSSTVLVPLEDGDRCEALVALGKEVLVIDLNPLSRTARKASVTIVDEVSRAANLILNEIIIKDYEIKEWDNESTLRDALEIISKSMNKI